MIFKCKQSKRYKNFIVIDYEGERLYVNRKFDIESRIVELLTQLLTIQDPEINCSYFAQCMFKCMKYEEFAYLCKQVR